MTSALATCKLVTLSLVLQLLKKFNISISCMGKICSYQWLVVGIAQGDSVYSAIVEDFPYGKTFHNQGDGT